MTRLLIELRSETQYREMRRVAIRARSAGWTVQFALYDNPSTSAADRIRADLGVLGFQVATPREVAPEARRLFVRLWERLAPTAIRERLQVTAVEDQRRRIRASIKRADDLLAESDPSLIIVGEDGMGGNRPLIRAALNRHLPVLVVPYEFSGVRQPLIAIREQDGYERIYGLGPGPRQWINKRAAARYPHWLLSDAGERLLRAPGEQVLAEEAEAIAPPQPWSVQGGRARVVAVESERIREQYAGEGIPRSRLEMTGSLAQDDLADALSRRAAIRKRLNGLGDADEDSALVLCALPPWYPTRAPDDLSDYGALARKWLAAFPNPVVQLHPSVAPEHRAMVATVTRRLVDDDVAELIAACDLLVTSVSSIIRLAIAAGRPVLNWDVYRFRYDDYRNSPGVITVESTEEFCAMAARFSAPPEIEELASLQRRDSDLWGRLDGGAGDRLMELMTRVAREAQARS